MAGETVVIPVTRDDIIMLDIIIVWYLLLLRKIVPFRKHQGQRGTASQRHKETLEALHHQITQLLLSTDRQLEGVTFPLSVEDAQALEMALGSFIFHIKEIIASTKQREETLLYLKQFQQQIKAILSGLN